MAEHLNEYMTFYNLHYTSELAIRPVTNGK